MGRGDHTIRRGDHFYWDELENQIIINKHQIEELRDVASLEKIKMYFSGAGALLIIVAISYFLFFLIFARDFYLLEHYATLINIGAVFALFGLFELFSFFFSALSLSREIRRLINRHLVALEAAARESAARFHGQ